MPQKNIPPDWFAYCIYMILTGIAGAFGAFVRQIHGPVRKWPQRVVEWLGGALCAIYGAEIVAQTIYHLLSKNDLIHSDYVVPEKIIGLAGFLCGALGVSIIDGVIIFLYRHINRKN